jgi:hypothetical protein
MLWGRLRSKASGDRQFTRSHLGARDGYVLLPWGNPSKNVVPQPHTKTNCGLMDFIIMWPQANTAVLQFNELHNNLRNLTKANASPSLTPCRSTSSLQTSESGRSTWPRPHSERTYRTCSRHKEPEDHGRVFGDGLPVWDAGSFSTER